MLYHPDYIVYLWLIPVVLVIVIPAFFKAVCALYRMTESGQAACAREYARQKKSTRISDRRKHPRVELIGAVALVNGTEEHCTGVVANVSRLGVCLKNLPQALLNKAEKFRVQVCTRAGDFDLIVSPRWEKLFAADYMVGAEIVKVPTGWEEYVHNLTRRKGP